MHEIRLRRPWEKRLKGQTETRRIDVPEAESDATLLEASSATYSRNFNRPPGLPQSARVHLRIEAWQGQLVSLTLNDHPLEITRPPLSCEVTEWLEPHNQIEIELCDADDQRARLTGEVVLVIEE